MSSRAIPVDAQQLPSPALRRFAWGVLVYFIAVILWGTLVRATGAGAGCGNHWPLCNGTVMQHSASVNTMIEFTHRITSGLSFFSAVGLLVWTFAGTVRGHLARAAAVAAVAFTLVEAILGALLVKLGLTAQSQSPLRAPVSGAAPGQHTAAAGRAHAHRASAQPRRTGYLRGHHSAGGSIWRGGRHCVGDDRGRHRLAGGAGRHALPGVFARLMRLAAGFFRGSGWLVRWRWTHPTVALLAGDLSHLAAGSRTAQRKWRTGTIARCRRWCRAA